MKVWLRLWSVCLLACLALPAYGQKTVQYFHTDALGSVVAVTGANGALIEQREYEPYGAQLTPAVQDGPGYTGHVQDAETGLVYMQQRYYDSMLGVFLSVDPVSALGGPILQFNRYRYAASNPYRFNDPDGRRPCEPQDCGASYIGARITGMNVNSSNFQARGGGGRDSGSSAQDQRSSSAPAQQGSTGAPTSDGRIPVPGVVGWKTGQYDMSMTPEQVDSAGLVISGSAIIGGGAIAVQAGTPYVAATSSGLIAGTKSAWGNLSFDGPSPGGLHANGRLLGIRWKGGQWGVRLDLHPINSGSTPILHINYGPAARGEAAHLILFDPRWIGKGD